MLYSEESVRFMFKPLIIRMFYWITVGGRLNSIAFLFGKNEKAGNFLTVKTS